MKVFAMIRKVLPIIGVLDFYPAKRNFLTIVLIGNAFGLIIYGAVTAIWYIVFEARTFDEYAKASASLTICTYAFMVSTAIRLRQDSFETMFKSMETLFMERKL